MDPKTQADTSKEGTVQGEGDYVAGRRFQEAERSFVESGPVDRKAREAEKALEGPDGAELERARLETSAGEPHRKTVGATHPDDMPDTSDPHTERNLDKGLDETFPASDPVSISPGAD